MSASSFANSANAKFNGNIVLNNGYLKFPNGSIQTTAGGGSGGGNVSTTTNNIYTNTSTNDFENSEITCATQLNSDNSTYVANTEFVQTRVGTVGIYDNNNTGIGNNVFNNIDLQIADNNTAFGSYTLSSITTGSSNCGFGVNVCTELTTGSSNCGYGNDALSSITTGSENCGYGNNVLYSLTTGSSNCGYGFETLTNLTTGSANCGYGSNALYALTTGINNTCVGYNAGNVITTSSFNTSVGFASLIDVTGSNNTAIGYNAGVNDETGSNNTYLGSQAQQQNLDTSSYNYLTLIGSDSQPVNVGSNNQIVLGRLNGDDELFIPGNNIFLGNQNNIDETYTIQASGENSTIIFTTQPSVPAVYQNTLSLSSTLSELTSDQITLTGNVTISGDLTIPSPNNLSVNNIEFVNQNGDPGYTTNATIYLNTTVTATQQLRCNINGTLYYINLTAV